MLTYQPSDWYWIIGADTGNVWSSARAMLVPTSDPNYSAWLDLGGTARQVATMADVEAAMIVFPPGTPRTYAADVRYRKASGGVIVTSLGGSIPFLSDPVSRNTVNSAYDYLLQKDSGTVQWKMSDGSFVPLDKNQISTLMNDMAGFVQSCFSVESQMSAGITDGSITTLAQIDAAFAAISNVFP